MAASPGRKGGAVVRDPIICRCEGVRLSEIEESIREGASAVPGVKKRTRVGMGPCQGRVCQRLVRDLVQQGRAKDGPVEPALQRSRSPVRPTLLRDL